MVKITIGVIRQRRRLVGPDKEVVTTEVPYTTDLGYEGLVKLPTDRLDEKTILEAVKQDAELSSKLIGTVLEDD
ncbi:MAG: hypothetical protein SVV88_11625 [Pseudomonadota bacterium]|nr:hypothetical protein [Pseudomonadota bacterium]